jgi:hypothetical protein
MWTLANLDCPESEYPQGGSNYAQP